MWSSLLKQRKYKKNEVCDTENETYKQHDQKPFALEEEYKKWDQQGFLCNIVLRNCTE
jgi:cell shape-determining protein MreC